MKKLVPVLLLLNIQFAFAQNTSTPTYGNNSEAGHYLTLDGAKIYYETYGQGEQLLLIHGNGGNIAYMQPQIE